MINKGLQIHKLLPTRNSFMVGLTHKTIEGEINVYGIKEETVRALIEYLRTQDDFTKETVYLPEFVFELVKREEDEDSWGLHYHPDAGTSIKLVEQTLNERRQARFIRTSTPRPRAVRRRGNPGSWE